MSKQEAADGQHALVGRQFGSQAEAYLASGVHAAGADLERLSRRADASRPARVLDLGCGAGHVSYALARGGASEIVAYDLAPQMLAVVAAEARQRGHANIVTDQGPAERLPFDSARFDWVVSRFSAHHWLRFNGRARRGGASLQTGWSLHLHRRRRAGVGPA
jgi:SAM-dependent methyltransferase